jgi:hypothetical protein
VNKMCSKDMKMVMFGHKHCFNDLVLSTWVHFYLWFLFFSCIYIFVFGAQFVIGHL